MFLHEQTRLVFSSFTCKTWSLVIQHCRLLLFLVPLDVCLLLILHLSQQVDWASITSYIDIYTCIQHHMYPPNSETNEKKKNYSKLPFSPLKLEKPAWQSTKKVCMEALLFDVRYAAGCRGAGAGGWHGMQPYSIERGRGGWAYSSPPPIQMGLFLCSWVLDSHYAGRRVIGCRHRQCRSSPTAKNTGVECECISTIFWHLAPLTTAGAHSCSWVCQGADMWASWLGGGQQALVRELSTKFQLTWP